MRKTNLLCIVILTSLLSSSIGQTDVPVPTSGVEVVHSIYEYDDGYQEKARSLTAEMMSHWNEDGYIRWRPVRIEPGEILQTKITSESALPASLQLTVFPDIIVSAQRTSYAYREVTGNAMWEGVIPGFEKSRVEIKIVDMTDRFANTEERIAFVIRIWDSSRQYVVLPTDDLDIYVAVEVLVPEDTSFEWAPDY